jgi:hypothetical protein
MKIEIDLNFTEQNCLDTLTTALECNSISYWVNEFVEVKRNSDLWVTEFTISYLGKNDKINKSVITPETIRKGIKKMFKAGFDISYDIKQQLLEEEPSVDSECADCIIQTALFGEMIYG